MKPTLHAIRILEAENYVTQSMIIFIFVTIEKEIINLRYRYEKTQKNDNAKFLLKVAKDLQEELNEIWDHELPEETLLAAYLDPRFKSLDGVPKAEVESTHLLLKFEYEKLLASQEKLREIELESSDSTKDDEELAEDPLSLKRKREDSFSYFESRHKKQEQQLWRNEIEMYKFLPEIGLKEDPLKFWQENQDKFPILSKLAKMNLGIPASQASTERSFSTAGNICTKKRNCLSPEHVERLTIFHQNINRFEVNK